MIATDCNQHAVQNQPASLSQQHCELLQLRTRAAHSQQPLRTRRGDSVEESLVRTLPCGFGTTSIQANGMGNFDTALKA